MPLGFDGVVEADRVVRTTGCESAGLQASRWIESHLEGVRSAEVRFTQTGFSVDAVTEHGKELLEYVVRNGKGRLKRVNGSIKERNTDVMEQREMDQMHRIGLMVNRTYRFSARQAVAAPV